MLITGVLDRTPKPGEGYLHYKGGQYLIIAVSTKEDDLSQLVIYTDGEKMWARTLENFNSILGDDKEGTQFYRFQRIEESRASAPALPSSTPRDKRDGGFKQWG